MTIKLWWDREEWLKKVWRWCYQGLIQTRGEMASMHNLRDIQNFHRKRKVSLTIHFFTLINSSFKMNASLPLPTTIETTFRTVGHSHLHHSGCYQRNRISKLCVYLYIYNSMDRGAWWATVMGSQTCMPAYSYTDTDSPQLMTVWLWFLTLQWCSRNHTSYSDLFPG